MAPTTYPTDKPTPYPTTTPTLSPGGEYICSVSKENWGDNGRAPPYGVWQTSRDPFSAQGHTLLAKTATFDPKSKVVPFSLTGKFPFYGQIYSKLYLGTD